MVYISLSFDDGRSDNYEYAYPVMKNHNISGTLFTTTGYIDNSWEKDKEWLSTDKPLKINELKILHDNGWEIALHGDKHLTEVDDLCCAMDKLQKWGFDKPFGFSVPNSDDKGEINRIIKEMYNRDLLYIRNGRLRKTRKLSSIILYILYRIFKIQFAYNHFNNVNLNSSRKYNPVGLSSVVIRKEDNASMILNFIDQCDEDMWCIFMLHSVLPSDNSLLGADPWAWNLKEFTKLIDGLDYRIKEKKVTIDTIAGFLNRGQNKWTK